MTLPLWFACFCAVCVLIGAAQWIAERWWQERTDRLMRRGFKAALRLGYVNRYREDKR